MDTSGPSDVPGPSQGNIASMTAQLNNVTAELASMHMQIRAEKESAAAYQRDADTVRQALAVLSAEVKTYEYEAASPAPSTAQKMSTINILKQKNKTRKRVFMRQVKAQIDADIRELGQCEPREWFEDYYCHAEGFEEFAELNESVTRWNGHEHMSVTDAVFRSGVATGTSAAKDNLKQDRYKTLFINDSIGLHDKQHVVMLKATGLQGVLAGTLF
jgi:hypothetical protein